MNVREEQKHILHNASLIWTYCLIKLCFSQYLGFLGIKSCGMSIRLDLFFFIMHTLKMPNISLIEIKYCILEKANTNRVEWKV